MFGERVSAALIRPVVEAIAIVGRRGRRGSAFLVAAAPDPAWPTGTDRERSEVDRGASSTGHDLGERMARACGIRRTEPGRAPCPSSRWRAHSRPSGSRASRARLTGPLMPDCQRSGSRASG